MARWLLDSDVLIDAILKRDLRLGPSEEVLHHMRRVGEDAFVAWHSISNINYIVGKFSDRPFAREAIARLLEFAQIAPTATDDLRYALGLPMSDFEDAMQVAAARACQANFIVTRNTGDFARSPIPNLTPAQALAELSP